MTAGPAQGETTEFTNPNLELMYSADEIAERVRDLGAQITAEYAGNELVLVGVLKGSCVFWRT